MFINGSNPLITDKKLNNFDSFNLFATYDELECKPDNDFKTFEVTSVNFVFSTKYHELFGFCLKNKSNSVMSFIFQYDVILLDNLNSDIQFKEKLSNHLLHVPADEFNFVDMD